MTKTELKIDFDLSNIIGVKKYEKIDNNPKDIQPKKPKSGIQKYIYLFKYNILYKILPGLRPKSRTPFPKNLVPITDEERIQNIPYILEAYKNEEFYTNYKLDGSSITILHSKFLFKNYFRICSRRFELHDKHNDWYKVFKSISFENEILKLVEHFKTNNIIVQGEAIGKFNGNHHNLTKEEIRIFNIFVNGKKINQKEFIDTCYTNNIPHCPLYKIVTLNHTMEEIIKMSEIKDVLNPSVEAEGLVWRHVTKPVSFKVINNKFLLKHE